MVTDDPGLALKSPRELGEALRASDVEVAVSGHEGPSNRLCMALVFKASTDTRLASYSNPEVLRMVRDTTDPYTLWKQDGDVVVQAVTAPPASVVDHLEGIAAERGDDFLELWERVPQGAPSATARDWVSAIVYPRMPLTSVGEGPEYLYRWQTCALIGLAHCEPGWDGTQKRQALLSLLRGVIDWPMAAAVRVAAEVALHEPAAMCEVRQALIDLVTPLRHTPNGGLSGTLLLSLEMLPFVGNDFTQGLRESLAGGPHDDPAQVAEEAEPPPQPAKKPWWKIWGKN